MFKRLACISIYTEDIEESLGFYKSMGLKENWRLNRKLEDNSIWTLIGLKFADQESSELVISNHPRNKFTEIEITVDNVKESYLELSKRSDIKWIAEPIEYETNSVAVMQAPDGNIFVLVGK